MSAIQGSGLEGCHCTCVCIYVGSLHTAGWRDKLQHVSCTIEHSIISTYLNQTSVLAISSLFGIPTYVPMYVLLTIVFL